MWTALLTSTNLVLLLYIVRTSYGDESDVSGIINFLTKIEASESVDIYSIEQESVSSVSVADAQPQVQTSSGLIFGAKNEYANTFFSIPFAMPPVDDLRFRPPVKLDTPHTSRNHSTRIMNTCVQPTGQFNEDCLVLTVHVPKTVDLSDSSSPPNDGLPVLLFIHGGAFFIGAGTYKIYDGRFLSEATSSIVVTMNYRLGPLGFLVFDDGENKIEGNQGLRDQQLAMQWVRENIPQFGGDASKITLFGESAGAQSTMFHLLSKNSEPLFQRAIMESNPAAYWYPDRQQALSRTDELIEYLRCGPLNIDDCCGPRISNYTCLMESSPRALTSAMAKIMALSVVRFNVLTTVEPFRPFIDGVEFSDQPMTLFKDGNWNTNKPFIIGLNEEELVILKYFLPMNETIFRGMNRRLFEGFGHSSNTGDIISEKYIETYGPTISDYSHIFGIQMTDIIFGCPTRAMARFASATTQSHVYYYIFSHSLDGEDCEDIFGNFCEHSYHSAELFFVFRTIDHLGMIPDEEDVLVSNQFSTYWGNMAWTGSPSEGPDFGLEGDFPKWITYAKEPAENSWTNLRISNPDAYLEVNYLRDLCDFWDSLGVYEAPEPDLETTTTLMSTTSSAARINVSTMGFSILLFLCRCLWMKFIVI